MFDVNNKIDLFITYMKRRMEHLEKEINNQVDRINTEENSELLEMVYLFYDGFDYNFN